MKQKVYFSLILSCLIIFNLSFINFSFATNPKVEISDEVCVDMMTDLVRWIKFDNKGIKKDIDETCDFEALCRRNNNCPDDMRTLYQLDRLYEGNDPKIKELILMKHDCPRFYHVNYTKRLNKVPGKDFPDDYIIDYIDGNSKHPNRNADEETGDHDTLRISDGIKSFRTSSENWDCTLNFNETFGFGGRHHSPEKKQIIHNKFKEMLRTILENPQIEAAFEEMDNTKK